MYERLPMVQESYIFNPKESELSIFLRVLYKRKYQFSITNNFIKSYFLLSFSESPNQLISYPCTLFLTY